jgi:predicted anti-sigma-YlaC factor YlaD
MEPKLSCGHDPLAIAAVADGAASALERAEVEERLLACRSCLRYWERLRWLAQALRETPPPPPIDLASRVLAAVEREERRRLPLRFAVTLAAALFVMIGMAMTIAPAEGLAESAAVGEPIWVDLTGAVAEPLSLAIEMDRLVVAGLSLALVASVVLLGRLIRVSEG